MRGKNPFFILLIVVLVGSIIYEVAFSSPVKINAAPEQAPKTTELISYASSVWLYKVLNHYYIVNGDNFIHAHGCECSLPKGKINEKE